VTGPYAVSVPAAPGTAENEDAYVVGDGAVVVVDGAGLPHELRAGCHHTVAWFATSVASTFHGLLRVRQRSMSDALAETIATVRASHETSCRLAEGSPSATVAAWRTNADQVEYLVLCDASLVLVDHEGTATEVTDHRLQDVLDAVGPPASPTRPAEGGRGRATRTATIEAARNAPGGFWCVQADPAAAAEALIGDIPVADLGGVLACSDGAARAYGLLGTHTLDEFAATALSGDGEALAARIRTAEEDQADNLRRDGVKVHDDLTVVAQRFIPERDHTSAADSR
jgi:hypothetical protein